MIALALQGSVLLKHGNSAVTAAFMESRLGDHRFGCFGTLKAGADVQDILLRAAPIQS
jgi:putative acyl-CoA dehydrogenase